MLQLIIDLLTPVFKKLGVSPVDVETYVNSMSSYIYVILITIVLVAAVMIAAHWLVKKGIRHIVRWGAGISGILIITVIANLICYGPMYNNISIILNSTARVTEESAVRSKEVIEDTGDEGMVLVKNKDNLLPLAESSNINVFGWASTNPIYGGTGSGSSDSSDAVGIIESLENAGFKTNKELTKLYTNYRETRNTPGVGVSGTDWTLPEPTVDTYTNEIMNQAKEFSDTALIVLSRSGGEGSDVPSDMNKVIKGTWDIRDEVAGGNENYNYFTSSYENNSENNSENYDDFDPGESYLELSNTEEAMIEKVCGEFENVVVVVNANNIMELGWVDQYESIQSVILTPGTGTYGMSALGRILDGEVNPSGRTVDTYVYDLTQTPTAKNQGNFSFNNVDDLKEGFLKADSAYQGNISFVNYVESIYVGYKFYETASEEGTISYEETVQYPFGYGLSYTTFTQEIKNFTDDGDKIFFEVEVTNTGDTAGKDVVEVYFTPPYNNGGIEKASVNLIDFEKTQLLEPGATEIVPFEIDKEDMASYDAEKLKAQDGGYILEAGKYSISIRSDSHNVIAEELFTVDTDIDYSKGGRSSDYTAANNQFEDYSVGTVEYLSRADQFANYKQVTSAPGEDKYVMDDKTRERIMEKSTAYYDPTKYDNPNDEMPVTGAKNGMKLADMTGKDYEDPDWESLLDQLTVDEMTELVNLGGFQTIAVKSVDKVMTMDSDGTSGVNDWVTGVYGTAFPTEVLIAQTWSKEIATAVGDAMGAEYADCEIYGWYGPAMNIHRNAYTGRNFEYYSEDGVLSGKIASATVNAAGEHGVYAYIKHFALNDQETNRCTFLLTYAKEQAIREIFLRPFEECVKNYDFSSKPLAVMSSFNFIGDVYCGSNPHLLNNVLRDEWGFRGMVLTDWDGSYGYQNTDDCIRNGNDIMLGFNSYESNKITDTDAASCVIALRNASKNIMYTVANSGAYTIEKEKELFTPMTKMFIVIDAAIVLINAAIMAVIMIRQRKKRKLAEEEATV
ncbi:MAG: beta-glucosidase [Dorea sp.]|nr:beta-glucosidase [Dorea sp.]